MKNDFSVSSKYGIIWNFVKGAILGIAITAIFMAVLSAIMLFMELDRVFAAPFATLSLAAGSLSAAFYGAKKAGNRGYFIGLMIGIVVFTVITLISLVVEKSGLSYNTLFHFIIIVLSSTIGGILGVNKDRNKKYI